MLRQSNTIYAFEEDMFESLSGLSIRVEEPAPDAENPILGPGQSGTPDDSKICYPGSIAPWGSGYGMWYLAEDQQQRLTICLAYSDDGFNWTRRGVIAGADQKYMILAFNVWNDGEQFLAAIHTLDTLKLEHVTDSRIRGLMEKEEKFGRSGVAGVCLAESGDGVDWTLSDDGAPIIPMRLNTPRLYRFQNRYVMNAQANGLWFDPPQAARRIVVFYESDDLRNWKMHETCMTNRTLEAQHGQTHCGIVPIKCIDDRMMIGLGGRFDDSKELTDQHFDITLLYSYNGIDWRPLSSSHEHRSWIRRGRKGEWDFGGVVGMGLTENGDQAAVYYSATEIGNCSHSFHLYDPGPSQVGRAIFKRDRFAALQPAVGWNAVAEPENAVNAFGVILTRPIRLDVHRQMTMNIEIPVKSGKAAVIVEIVDSDGAVYDSAQLPHGGVRVPVPFEKPVPDRPVRIRITMAGGSSPDDVPQFFAMEY
jgi:hypothetical protein